MEEFFSLPEREIMDYQDVAAKLLANLGSASNISKAMTCLTRLRLTLNNTDNANLDAIRSQSGVLGVVMRGANEVEVVFGPSSIEGIGQAFEDQSGLKLAAPTGIYSQSAVKNIVDENDDLPEHDEPSEHARTKLAAQDVMISAGRKQSYRAQQHAAIDTGRLVKEDIDALKAFLSENGDIPKRNTTVKTGKSVLVINGPNLNMLGIREPDIYGKQNYNTLINVCKAAAKEAGFVECRCYQSNHEGGLVDEIQSALGVYDGIVINPGAYTHTSVAILDAVKAVALPCVEVHISKVDEREDFRQVSYIRKACFETITGLGIEGYRKAILDLAKHLEME